ncbi:MAG: PQQ-dependent sugar dehydrogenase [Verrucomicrobiae bacterium]|nr:PQQ-dependent sugar dehydrogenase [Verrucomicrobiae bacterium]
MQAKSILSAFFLVGAVVFSAFGQHWTTSPPRFPFTAPSSTYSLTNALGSLLFSDAISLAVPPGRTNSLFITRKNGMIDVITNLAAPTATRFLDLSAKTFTDVECGLTGLAFHPDYAENGSFFVFYTRTNSATAQMHDVVARFQVDPSNPWRALPQSEQTLIAARDYDPTHQAGDLHFGPDGYLYVSIGDGGGAWGAFTNAQRVDLDMFSGILRLDVDGRPDSLAPNPHPSAVGGYWIPTDNPFIGATSFGGQSVSPSAVRTEFWAVGFRNPYRFSFDPANGRLYVGEVGNSLIEEVNRVVAGGNFGWSRFEGTNQRTSLPSGVTYLPPLYQYQHTASGGNQELLGDCVVGGIVYRGLGHPELYGKYVFGDYVARHIWAMNPSGTGIVRLTTAAGGPVCFFTHPGTGELLVVERGGTSGGRVSRLVRTSSDANSLPQTLSQTGVFTDLSTLATKDGILPYEINAPFWSDNAEKFRWFFLQDPGSVITRDAADQWALPTGAVWVKHFEIELTRGNPASRKRLETRFIVKTTDSVYGLTYRWRANGSDADLVPEGGANETLQIVDGGITRSQVWHYPGRSECLVCHNATGEGTLGFNTRQLNRDVTVAGVSINQLTALGNLNVFSPRHGSPASLPRVVAITDSTASPELRFRSYLDVNCSYCHQPGGLGRGTWDGRLSTPLAQAGIINGSVLNDLGISGARVLVPGSLDTSILWHRINEMDEYHMPPLATSVPNDAGVELVRLYTLWASTEPARTIWQIGTDNLPTEVPYDPAGEFSIQNGKDDSRPGLVTRLPWDPLYNGGANPTADDDFYFAGYYPIGFNGLNQERFVPFDEPPVAWERANTTGDRTNRMHFILDPGQLTSKFRLSMEFPGGTTVINGETLPGIGQHDMVFQFRNGAGRVTTLYSQRLTQRGVVQVEFTAAAVQATQGANTIELIRTGPVGTGITGWILYDYVRLEDVNIAPVLTAPGNRVVDELSTLSFNLQATDANSALQTLTYSLVSGPSGLKVSAAGLLTWTPTEAQGPGVYTVTVRVTDSGTPALSDTRQFTVTVNDVPNSTRTVWQIGATDGNHAEFSAENAKEDPAPGTLALDDDYYTAGTYPAGFNALTAPLVVAQDEDWLNWERAHTQRDPVNRLHFVTTSGPAVLNIVWGNAGWSSNGVSYAADLSHQFRIQHVGGGTTTTLFQGTVPERTTMNLSFSAANGANSIIIQRTGPAYSTTINSWMIYDSLRISK